MALFLESHLRKAAYIRKLISLPTNHVSIRTKVKISVKREIIDLKENQCRPHLASAARVTQTCEKLPFRNICILLSQILEVSPGAMNATCLVSLNEKELAFPRHLSRRAQAIEKLALKCFSSGSD